ncbi:MAG: glutamate racemase, partial [Rhodobiaceae bacterium]|nr:glutamate racemase [Rhodobiaceae bacterium]
VNRMRKVAPWPVDWIDPAEAIARRARSLIGDEADTGAGEDIAVFTSGIADQAIRRVLKGFGLRVETRRD